MGARIGGLAEQSSLCCWHIGVQHAETYLAVEVVDGLVLALHDLVQAAKAHVGLELVAQSQGHVAALAVHRHLVQRHLNLVACCV